MQASKRRSYLWGQEADKTWKHRWKHNEDSTAETKIGLTTNIVTKTTRNWKNPFGTACHGNKGMMFLKDRCQDMAQSASLLHAAFSAFFNVNDGIAWPAVWLNSILHACHFKFFLLANCFYIFLALFSILKGKKRFIRKLDKQKWNISSIRRQLGKE